MIHINSYLFRGEFRDLMLRWMYGISHPSDASLVHRLVHFNNVYIDRYLTAFSRRIFSELHPGEFVTRQVHRKRDLKDVIVADPPTLSPRVEALIRAYRERPGDFYGDTPFHGTLCFERAGAGLRYVGSNRIKRVRRLAEKCARRIIDQMFAAIKRHADELATDRAARLGMRREQLTTSPEEMRREFETAEADLLADLRDGKSIDVSTRLEISDVAGIKVILEAHEFPRILTVLQNTPDCRVLEVERHTGNYNATNLIVAYAPDKDAITERPLGESTLRVMRSKGLDVSQAHQDFASFVHQGGAEVHLEIIVSTYQEMLESEIGRCMHEDRIMDQRFKQEYRGALARNVEHLMVYLFNFAYSPHTTIGDLPILLWNKYLPDYFDEIFRAMFDLPPLRLVD